MGLRFALLSLPLLIACGENVSREIPPAVDSTALRVPPRVAEAFLIAGDSTTELRGITVWYPADGDARILTTAPAANAIHLRSSGDGALLESYARRGRGAGALGEPIGIATHDSLLFVVERGNHRVQVFRLPAFEIVGSFGSEELIAPEWIALLRQGRYIDAYVSDRPDMASDTARAARVRLFRVTADRTRFTAGLMRTFGEVGGLTDIRGFAIDSAQDRILIADRAAGIVGFTLGGDPAGLSIGASVFDGGADAIALRTCSRDGGQWFVTDTARSVHVFDRATLAPITRFWGRTLAPTGGVQFVERPDPAASHFLAVHARAGIGSIAWPAVRDSVPALRACPGAN